MHKIDSAGATVDNRFTEGNAALSVPATVVSEKWLNAVQDELTALATATGASLNASGSDTGTQLLTAVKELISRGGLSAPLVQTIANNTAAADVSGFPNFLSTQVLAVTFYYRIFRRTDSDHVLESGQVFMTYDSETSSYQLTKTSVHDDSGVLFAAVPTGSPNQFKLQYTSDNLAGASYSGTLSITDIKMIRA